MLGVGIWIHINALIINLVGDRLFGDLGSYVDSTQWVLCLIYCVMLVIY